MAAAGPSKLLIGGLALAAATTVLLFALFYNSKPEYSTLYSRLAPEDAGAIVSELESQKIPYQLSGDGSAIMMPADKIPSARINLAVKGLPSKNNVGFEIFDNQKLGVTDMVQKTNLMRATSGELERTISSMPEIESARVHLSVPKESLFIEDQKNPKASVVIQTRGGATLDKAQIMGIINLTSAAISGLSPDDVSIVDTNGGLIWSKEMQAAGLLNDDQLKLKARYEEQLKRRIQNMLEKVVGYDRSITTVTADLDLKEVITNEDIYDPEQTAARSESKIVEKNMNPGRVNAGAPNATYELGTANRQISGQDGEIGSSRTEELTNYEVSNTKRQTISRAGDIKKVSVSVLVDGQYVENENGEKVFQPRSPEFIKQLEAAIKGAVGFDEKRGDIVSISSAQFVRPDELPLWSRLLYEFASEFGRPLFNFLLIILFFFLVIRPIMNWLKKEVEPAGSGAEAPVLPEYPTGGPSFGDALPVSPKGQALTAQEAAEIEESVGPSYDLIDEDALPDYSEEGDESGPAKDEGIPALAYGNLNRENILPLARDNMERTVGLLRGWIEQKSPQEDQNTM